MLTRKSTLEWSFARDDEEWQKFETALSSKTNVAATQIGFWYKNRAYLMLLVVALMGFVLREAYTWQKTRTLQAMQEDEVRSAIEMDLLAVHNDGQIVTLNLVDEHADERWKQKTNQQQRHFLSHLDWEENVPKMARGSLHWTTDVQKIDVRENYALVEVLLRKSDTPLNPQTYRATHFYRRTTEGWKQTTPVAYFWGPPRTLTTDNFTIHFRERDAASVVETADRLDALYTTMRTDLGLPIPLYNDKLTIKIIASDTPVQNAHITLTGNVLTVSSPVLAVAPVELAEADILYQAVAILLAQHSVNQRTHMLLEKREDVLWWPVVSGLRLWLIWDSGGPLTTMQTEIVEWLYRDPSTNTDLSALYLPDHYDQICQQHKVWHLSPAAIGTIFACTETDSIVRYQRNPPLYLRDIGGPLVSYYDPLYGSRPHPGVSVAVATLFDYIAGEYGRDQLPALLIEMNNHLNWHTLIPAVFNISVDEFEDGWWAYLTETYNVTIQ
ncbi:hypothetical protein KFU94_25370 [Chloroflexi bacterium TSY]|nr:hypothetical protein [Chloroflexi bacterium TSY]